MTICETFDHRGAGAIVDRVESFARLFEALRAHEFRFERGSAAELNEWLEAQFVSLGWAHPVKVAPPFKPTINASHGDVGLTAQTGNIARAFYDLLKFQSLFLGNRLQAACLLLPCKPAARRLGQNVASFERVHVELANVYKHVITIPTLLVSLGA